MCAQALHRLLDSNFASIRSPRWLILDQNWVEMIHKSLKFGQMGLSWAIGDQTSLRIARINSDLKGSGYESSYGILGVFGAGLVAWGFNNIVGRWERSLRLIQRLWWVTKVYPVRSRAAAALWILLWYKWPSLGLFNFISRFSSNTKFGMLGSFSNR